MSNIDDVGSWLYEEFDLDIWPNPVRAVIDAAEIYFNGDIIASWKLVRRKNKGNYAKFVQAMLICLGYSCCLDGIFGPDSVQALKQYQKDNKFIVNGIAGKAVIRKMFARDCYEETREEKEG